MKEKGVEMLEIFMEIEDKVKVDDKFNSVDIFLFLIIEC